METIKCTAWDCIGNYSDLIDNTYSIRVIGGKIIWEMAFPVRGYQRVRLARLITNDGIRQINRYVNPDTPVELIPIVKHT